MLNYLLLFAGVALMLFPTATKLFEKMDLDSILIINFILVIAGLLLWVLFGTWCRLTKKDLIYHLGPMNGRIAIDQIHTIIKGKTL